MEVNNYFTVDNWQIPECPCYGHHHSARMFVELEPHSPSHSYSLLGREEDMESTDIWDLTMVFCAKVWV